MKTLQDNIKPIIVLSIMAWVMTIYAFSALADLKLDPDLKSFMNMTFIMAISYYIGSSTGQSKNAEAIAKKDETINNLIEKQK